MLVWLSWVCGWAIDYNITIFWVCVWFWVGSGFVVELGLCWVIKFYYNVLLWFFCVVELGLWLVLGLCLSWVCVEQSSLITIFFYDFSVFDFWVCMIFWVCALVCSTILGFWIPSFLFVFLFFVFLNLSLCLVLDWFWVCFCVLIVFNSVFSFFI